MSDLDAQQDDDLNESVDLNKFQEDVNQEETVLNNNLTNSISITPILNAMLKNKEKQFAKTQLVPITEEKSFRNSKSEAEILNLKSTDYYNNIKNDDKETLNDSEDNEYIPINESKNQKELNTDKREDDADSIKTQVVILKDQSQQFPSPSSLYLAEKSSSRFPRTNATNETLKESYLENEKSQNLTQDKSNLPIVGHRFWLNKIPFDLGDKFESETLDKNCSNSKLSETFYNGNKFWTISFAEMP